MALGLITFLIAALLLVAWLVVSILAPNSNLVSVLKEAVCDRLGC
ncbi:MULTISPECIES: hypothetical protein [Rossellomorea]|nr:hypothetical protein [Rossellomorea aquimaris]